MQEYTQGVCADGAAILCDGKKMTIEQIIERLRKLEEVRDVICKAPEINENNYYDEYCIEALNEAMYKACNIIE